MKHYGDITKLSGYDLPIVDVIIGGSPCQDLSVAGGRAGLEGERSGLFMEQVRIVKEMREHDRELHGGRADVNYGLRPRYMVWENVPGAFSSNKGRDFQAVLTEIIRIVEPECPDVPMPEKGKWSKSGCIYDELGGWSVAWRVHDAQFWGVPQRRKRIALVADFGGLSAPEVLFERKGMSGYSAPGRETRETAAGDSESGIGEADRTDGELIKHDQTVSYDCRNHNVNIELSGTIQSKSNGGYSLNYINPIFTKQLCLNDQGGDRMDVSEDVAGTLRAQDHSHPPLVVASAGFKWEQGSNSRSIGYEQELSPTLNTSKEPAVVILEHHPADSRIGISSEQTIQTLTGRMGTGGGNVPLIISVNEGKTK